MLPINLILYLLIKHRSSTFVQITVFVFIFGLPTLVNHKERTRELSLSEIHGDRKGLVRLHETSNKYTCFQKIVLLFQRITVIPENYNKQIVTQGKNHKKEKKEAEKREKMEREASHKKWDLKHSL